MKRVIPVLLAMAMVLSMIGCSSQSPETSSAASESSAVSDESSNSSSQQETPASQEIVYSDEEFNAAMTASPTSLDEGYSTNAHCRQASPFIFETLFTFDDSQKVIPQMVDTYTMSEDGLVYDLKLREGIKFHDGSDFTSEDAIASINRFKNTIQYGGTLDAITNMEAVSDYDLRITLDSPIGLLPALAFPQRCVMLPKEVAERNMETELKGDDIIGSGPYKLVEWVADVHIKLERFDDYIPDERFDTATGWGGKRIPYFKTINLLPVTEAEARMGGLETGEYDYAESIPNTSYDRITSNPDLQASIVKPRWSVAVEINHEAPFTSDVNFLHALIYAIDMEKVLTAVTSGNTEFYRLDPSLYTPEQYYYTEAGSEGLYNSPDPAKVEELLAAAGYNGEEIIFLTNRDFDFMYKACLSLEEQWKAAGINIKLEFSDWASQINKALSMEGWHLNMSGLSPRLDPTMLNSHLNSASSGGYGFNDPEVDQLLAEIGMSAPDEERKAIWEQIQTKIWEEVPFIKIGDFFELEALNAKYTGYSSFITARFWNVFDSEA